VEIVERREAYDEDRQAFASTYADTETAEAKRISQAMAMVDDVSVERQILVGIAAVGVEFQVDGHRADIVTAKAAQALAAYEQRDTVDLEDVERVAPIVLAHRVGSAPGSSARVDVSATLRSAVANL
jgi:Mg-chelatase subunit ChlI